MSAPSLTDRCRSSRCHLTLSHTIGYCGTRPDPPEPPARFRLTPEQREEVRRQQAEDAAAWPGLPDEDPATIELSREEAQIAREAVETLISEYHGTSDFTDSSAEIYALRFKLEQFLWKGDPR